MTFQTLGIAFGILLLWFALLRRYLASRLGVFSFLSPVFGVLFSALLLGETLSWAFIAGGVAIIAGVIIVSAPAKRTAAR
jgi:drug/metabolite transporter (DMT)-like permease